MLNWHEVVNDDFDGPLLVTFCPLCQSGVVAERFVEGVETVFGISGLLWKEDFVLYDHRTESLWSQILATAISGPKTGEELTLVPSTLTTWGVWRTAHPNTTVLLPPPLSGTVVGAFAANYDFNLYANLAELEDSLDTGDGYGDTRLPKRALVLGIAEGTAARAYPQVVVESEGVVNDEFGGRPIVVAAGRDGTLVAFDRRVAGTVLTFEAAGRTVMHGGGSRWDMTSGLALSGPYETTRLAAVADALRMYWVVWLDFYPHTDVDGRDAEPFRKGAIA